VAPPLLLLPVGASGCRVASSDLPKARWWRFCVVVIDTASFHLWSCLLTGGQVRRRGAVRNPRTVMLAAFLFVLVWCRCWLVTPSAVSSTVIFIFRDYCLGFSFCAVVLVIFARDYLLIKLKF
jgi:uncharacterized membrane protein YozB (DUF420 family)